MRIDAWMQHPTPRFLSHDMFESLRRWTGTDIPSDELPVELTLTAMDAGSIDVGLISAWYGREGPLISNDEVAKFVAQAPDRLVGVALSRHQKARRGRRRTPKMCRGARVQGPSDTAVAMGSPYERPTLLPTVRIVR